MWEVGMLWQSWVSWENRFPCSYYVFLHQLLMITQTNLNSATHPKRQLSLVTDLVSRWCLPCIKTTVKLDAYRCWVQRAQTHVSSSWKSFWKTWAAFKWGARGHGGLRGRGVNKQVNNKITPNLNFSTNLGLTNWVCLDSVKEKKKRYNFLQILYEGTCSQILRT